MTRHVRVDRLTGRMVHDPSGRRVGRIREMIGEVEKAGSGEYVVREFHLSSGGLIEALAGAQLARVIAARLGRKSNRVVVSWRDLDLSDPEHPRLRRSLAEVRGSDAKR